MRKPAIILLVLFLVCSLLFVTAFITIRQQQDRVTWQETTLFGDKDAAEGLMVQTRNTMDDLQLWQTEALLGQAPQTKFQSSIFTIKEASEETYDGIVLSVDDEFPSTAIDLNKLGKDTQVRYQSLVNYCQAATDRIPSETSIRFTVNLQDHLDYYPLDGWFDLPGTTDTSWHQRTMTLDPATLAWNAFNDYFKIPIIGAYTLKVDAYKNTVNQVNSITEAFAFYRPEFYGVTTEDTCYFTFDPVAADGQIADCSHIPGGYGIYSFRYHLNEKGDTEVDLDSLTTAISLDPSESFSHLWLTEDNTRLILVTTKDSKVLLTVIDLQTMTCLQKMELAAPSATQSLHIRIDSGFLAVFIRDPQNEQSDTVCVLAETPEGAYTPAFTTALNTDRFSAAEAMLNEFSPQYTMDFDGTRLAIAQNCMELTDAGNPLGVGCDFYILIYTAQGMAYAGRYDVNLTDINRTDSGLVCAPFDNRPITIRLEN